MDNFSGFINSYYGAEHMNEELLKQMKLKKLQDKYQKIREKEQEDFSPTTIALKNSFIAS